jgi:hypothetical protein
MASIEIVKMNDDLDSRIENGVETVTFFDPATGEKREIELGEANRKHFAAHLAKLEKYIAASRVVEVPAPATKPKAAAKSANKGELALIREWAKANGYQIGDRGRIKAEIQEAYHKAQGTVPAAEVASEPVKVADLAPADPADGCTMGALSAEDVPTSQEDIDQLLAEVTDGYSDAEIDEMLAEIAQAEGLDSNEDSE